MVSDTQNFKSTSFIDCNLYINQSIGSGIPVNFCSRRLLISSCSGDSAEVTVWLMLEEELPEPSDLTEVVRSDEFPVSSFDLLLLGVSEEGETLVGLSSERALF